MARVFDLALMNLKTVLRDKVALFFLMLVPILFMILIGSAFRGGGIQVYVVGYVNNDDGQYSLAFIDNLESPPAEWGLEDILEMERFDDVKALKEAFRLGDIAAGLVIESGFNPADDTVTLYLDETDVIKSNMIKFRVMAVSQMMFGPTPQPPSVQIKPREEPISVEFSVLNWLAPGLLSFGVGMGMGFTAESLGKHRERGTFSRLRTTPMGISDFLAGALTSNVILSWLQAVLLFVSAYLTGFRPMGATNLDKLINMAAAFLVASLLAVAFVGLGLVLAALAKSADQAVSIAWTVLIPMIMLSESWFTITNPTVKAISHVFPVVYANRAMRAILAFGAPLTGMMGDLAFLAAWATGAFLLGVLLFRKKTM